MTNCRSYLRIFGNLLWKIRTTLTHNIRQRPSLDLSVRSPSDSTLACSQHKKNKAEQVPCHSAHVMPFISNHDDAIKGFNISLWIFRVLWYSYLILTFANTIPNVWEDVSYVDLCYSAHFEFLYSLRQRDHTIYIKCDRMIKKHFYLMRRKSFTGWIKIKQ